jgi:hypothetical protein
MTLWPVLTRIALPDGLMEAVRQRVIELRRPTERQDDSSVRKLEARIGRTVARLNVLVPTFSRDPSTADAIAAACSLEYVDFRDSRQELFDHVR